ncbi:MAG: CrcB family protein [Planctomycetes bacterium]|nr:CrcB family protein [Planctomycetota bacterium]
MSRLVWIAVGGAAGSVARALLAGAVRGLTEHPLPVGVLAVNAVGSLLAGVLAGLWAGGGASEAVQALLMAGFLGGFTTYSAFNQETLWLLEKGRVGVAAGHVALTVAVCLALGIAGMAAGRALR